jgi:hypothetical protein
MTARATAQRLRELLTANPDGMTVHDLQPHLGTTVQNIRQSLMTTWGCYIADYKTNKAGPPAAIWKCVAVPKNAEPPANKWNREYHREYNRARHWYKKPKVEKVSKHVPQGLTVIRGPWPTMQ